MKEEEGRGGKEGQVREGKAENGMPGMNSSEGHGTERRKGQDTEAIEWKERTERKGREAKEGRE